MSIAAANRKYFDTVSDSYDDKAWFAKVNQQITDALQARLDWLGIPWANTGSSSSSQEVRQLDYACGPGIMSRIYGPYVTVTRGIDLSPNMVANYNARARAAGISGSTMNAVVGDLFDKEEASKLTGPEWQGFDLATVGMAFHHFEDVVHAAKCLKERLRPGGVLVLSDFLEGGDLKADDDGKPIQGTEGNHHTHHHHHQQQQQQHHDHHGEHSDNSEHVDDATRKLLRDISASVVVPHFTIEGVKGFLAEAGFVDIDVIPMEEKAFMDFAGKKLWRTVLFAKGRRPLEEKSEL